MLALIPLDNRPCNYRFPQQIAAIGGAELVTPSESWLGFFNTPGDPEAIKRWLEDLPEVEALIVSIDMAAYGGLVASRRPLIDEAGALARLQALREFHNRRPQTPIYAFNVLMRLAVTLDSDAAVAHYYNVMRYARLADEAERFDSQYLREELAKVQTEIPPAVLREYLGARARNHAVNTDMIEWLADGVFDYLLITQEDASEFGLHRREQDALLARAAALSVQDKMSLHPGADEAALTLLARHWKTQVRFRVHWSSLEDAHHIAPFEDRPYDEALTQHIKAMCGVQIEENSTATATAEVTGVEFDLFVNAPVGGSQNDEEEAARTLRGARLNNFVRDIEAALEAKRHVAVCDVAFPNGADNVLMAGLEKRGLLGRLEVFAAWNTAGNTTGTVLSQCAALSRAHRQNLDTTHLNRQFLFERVIDDWFYQSRVRGGMDKAARQRGLSPLRMKQEEVAPLEAQLRREMKGFAQLLAQRHFHTRLEQCDIKLPWYRTFEADIHADLA